MQMASVIAGKRREARESPGVDGTPDLGGLSKMKQRGGPAGS